eukprot:GFKZ01004862.1.p1 GENE.GFKZ01004862.1~~GFKZ01004862.1.p1  ORF type:complete len:510 (+),score=43.72 GFKZ01004862.1:38-1567(+)
MHAVLFVPTPALPRFHHCARRRPAPRCSQQPPNSPSTLQVVLERLSDTVLDARQHVTRLVSPASAGEEAEEGGGGVASRRVVVLGSGWAAHSLVKVLDPGRVRRVTVVSPRNFFFFTPLLNATAVGTVEFRSIVEPIRKSNPLVRYFEAEARVVDFERRVVRCVSAGEGEFEVPYDVLVIAVGETTATFGVPGAREHAFFLKEIADARNLRAKLLETLERAALPVWTREQRADMLHFVVVGGGPTGCEFAGELSDFVANDLGPRYGAELVSQIRVTLLQSGRSLLTQFETSLQRLALDNFQGRVRVRLRVRVKEVSASHVVLESGERIAYGVLVWAAGNGMRALVGDVLQSVGAAEPGAARGKIAVDEWLRVRGVSGVFAAGDCARMDEGLPATAQVAGQQGAYLGRLLSRADLDQLDRVDGPVERGARGREMRGFRFLSLGIMAYLGNDRAAVQVQAGDDASINIGGRVAYALWRSVYAVKQVDVRNRLLVLFDYFKTRVFGRDISQF